MKQLNFYAAFVSMILLAACDGKKIDRVHNAGAVQTKEDSNNRTDEQRTLSEKEGTVWTQDKAEMQKIFAEQKVDAAKVSVHLSKIEKTLLHSKTLEDKNYYLSLGFRDLLLEFNRGIVHLQSTSPEFLEKSGILKRYIAVLMDGCQQDLSECKNLAKFKVDQLTAQVLANQAALLDKNKITDANIHEFYQLVKASLDMQSRAKNYAVESLYFKHAIAYLQFLKKSKEPWAKANEARLKTDVSMILSKMNGQYASDELSAEEKKKYCEFIRIIDPLSSVDKHQILEEKKRQELVQVFLMCQAGQSSLEESLVKNLKIEKEDQEKDWIEANKNPEFAKSKNVQNMGYNFIVKSLEKDPKLVKSFNLKLNHAQDGSFFVIDKLYYEKITYNQAQQLIESLKTNSDYETIKMIRYYTQNQTAHLVNETLRLFALIFTRTYENLGLKDTLFREVISQVNAELFQPWYSHFRRIADIEKLLQVHFDRKYRSGFVANQDAVFTKTQKEILDLRSELANIKNHMNLVLTPPMEYAMFYYMSQVQGTVKFDYNFGTSSFTFDMKAEEILSKNVMPRLKAQTYRFFNIIPRMGESKEATEESLPILSFQYALKIGLFDKFPFNLVQKETKKSGIELFSTQFLKEIIVTKRNQLEKSLVDAGNALNDTDFKIRAEQLCLNPMDMKNNIESIATLQSGFGIQDKDFMGRVAKIYDKSKMLYEIQSSNANVNATNQVRLIVKDYLSSIGSDPQGPVIKLFDEQIGYISNLQKKITLAMLELDSYFVKGTKSCLKNMVRAEQFRRFRLLYEHMDHFKNVHAGITLLRMAQQKQTTDLRNLSNLAQSIQEIDVKTRVLSIIQKLNNNNFSVTRDEQAFTAAVNSLFAIHNEESLKSKYGYFVNERMLNHRDGKLVDLKKISFFDSNSYIEGTWDATLRTKSYLTQVVVSPQELSQLFDATFSAPSYIGRNIMNPQTTVNDSESLTIWRSESKIEIPFEENQAQFIRSAVRKFAGQDGNAAVSWFTGNDFLSVLNQRLEWLIEMSMTRPLVYGKQTEAECLVDGLDRVKKGASIKNYKSDMNSCGVIKITPDDVLNAFLEISEFYHHDKDERALYELMSRTGKNDNAAIKAFKYSNEESTREWTYFDEFIRKNYINKGNDAPYLEGMYGFNEFKKRRERGLTEKDHLLGIGQLPITLVRESLRKDILPQIQWVFKLEQAVKKMEIEHGKDKSKKLKDIIFAINSVDRNNEQLFENRWRYLHVNERSSGTPIYLRESEESMLKWFRGYIETATVQDGHCEFLPKPGDSDAMPFKKSKCADQFEEWFEVVTKDL